MNSFSLRIPLSLSIAHPHSSSSIAETIRTTSSSQSSAAPFCNPARPDRTKNRGKQRIAAAHVTCQPFLLLFFSFRSLYPFIIPLLSPSSSSSSPSIQPPSSSPIVVSTDYSYSIRPLTPLQLQSSREPHSRPIEFLEFPRLRGHGRSALPRLHLTCPRSVCQPPGRARFAHPPLFNYCSGCS